VCELAPEKSEKTEWSEKHDSTDGERAFCESGMRRVGTLGVLSMWREEAS